MAGCPRGPAQRGKSTFIGEKGQVLVRPIWVMSTTSVLQLTYHYSANQNLARFPDTKLRTLVSKNEKVVWQPQRSIMSAPKSGLYVRYCRHLNRSNRWAPSFLSLHATATRRPSSLDCRMASISRCSPTAWSKSGTPGPPLDVPWIDAANWL